VSHRIAGIKSSSEIQLDIYRVALPEVENKTNTK